MYRNKDERKSCTEPSSKSVKTNNRPTSTSTLIPSQSQHLEYRVTNDLTVLLAVNSVYPTGQPGSYSNSPPAGKTIHKCVNKR